ncbi:hypothetical protein D1872_256620 [compost metagenome]
MRLLLLRNAASIVAHRDINAPLVGMERDLDQERALVGSGLQRIIQQIHHDLLNPQGVPGRKELLLRSLHGNDDVLVLMEQIPLIGDFLNEHFHVQRIMPDLQTARR